MCSVGAHQRLWSPLAPPAINKHSLAGAVPVVVVAVPPPSLSLSLALLNVKLIIRISSQLAEKINESEREGESEVISVTR